MENKSRRAFFGKAFAGVAAVGAGASLVAMKKTWDPLPSVKSAGFTTVDVTPLEAGVLQTVKWRGKPVFFLKHTPEMEKNDARDVVVGSDRYTVVIGLCTHLGCIPSWKSDMGKFQCACHGGVFNAAGENMSGPPPRPLDIPPFAINGTSIVLGEEGPEYKALTNQQA